MFDLRRNSSKQAGGTPMKKLLAEELSKDMESKRRPPSVIARLMGLDALPPQQLVHEQPKIFSENYLQKTASIALQEKKPLHEARSSRKKHDKEPQEFKDVFEVREASKTEKQSKPAIQKWIGKSKPSDSKMALIRQKFMDAKRLSTDEKLQQSKEFHDALEVLDSNKDLLLKFLQEPDSLFTKHLHGLHGAPPPHQFGHITVLKSSNASKHEHPDICWKAERKTDQREDINSIQKDIVQGHGRDGAYYSSKLMKSRFEEKDEDCVLPTRIVVLKPNPVKAQNASTSASPSSSIGFHSENHQLFAEVCDRKNSSNNVRHRSKSSREIAREITRQMRQGVSSSSIRASSSRLKGYAGDESSCSMSEVDSANESEAVPPTSRCIFEWKNRYSPSSSCSPESSVSREAKKRLSERWKRTRRFQEVGLVGKGSTLGEMLAIPDKETQPATLGAGDGLARKDGIARCTPIGISSRDGWKDGYPKHLPRSKSVPASFTSFGSPKSGFGHGADGNDRTLMSKVIKQEPHTLIIRNSNHIEDSDSFLRDQSSKNEKPHFSFRTNRESNHSEQETHTRLDEPRKNMAERDQPEHKPIIPEPLSCDVADKRLIVEEVLVSEKQDMKRLADTPEEELPESAACIILENIEASSVHDANESILKEAPDQSTEEALLSANCSLPEPESPASSKEVDQPSPVSVLELPFVEDMSSGSECFERVSADLNGLRMQLQLLKLESSDPYRDGIELFVSSDEDTGEESVGLSEEKGEHMGRLSTGENRDYFYVVDVFVDSGLDFMDREMVLAASHSLECPVDPVVFEKLEKKYGEQLTWQRSERKLLFDRINYGLMEILRPSLDPHPWVKPAMRRLTTRYEESLVDDLWKLLVNQGEEETNDSSEKVLDREMRWLEIGDDIDVVGREIEKLLLDELIGELVSM
ncbi:uncharacterized protein LOC122086501 isoform X2 [Macadamia integrifolia]|nr:uncharacterized protein LOC122086501 isoform X2 [Macadamia integrifolia]XP_042511283.1 uncharacterized protein LOC122086501 isoform X2 [Macadamia integrifolia]XP_042511284.1 uncharacterized protein LOC122086501 isoform X2 [Macadamia integrifolia]